MKKVGRPRSFWGCIYFFFLIFWPRSMYWRPRFSAPGIYSICSYSISANCGSSGLIPVILQELVFPTCHNLIAELWKCLVFVIFATFCEKTDSQLGEDVAPCITIHIWPQRLGYNNVWSWRDTNFIRGNNCLHIRTTLSQKKSIFRDITWNVVGKTWYYAEYFRLYNVFHYISCYIAENRNPFRTV